MARIGILGGAFDPVHLGHLGLAEDALAQAGLDEVWLMPTAQSPLKGHGPVLSDEGRMALLEAAVADRDGLKVCGHEIERGGVSYTWETVQWLRREYPEASFCWIIGWDQACRLDQWAHIEELAGQLEFLIFGRPGAATSESIPEISGLRYREMKSRMLDISSTLVRLKIKEGEKVTHLLPKAVEALIFAQNLYLS